MGLQRRLLSARAQGRVRDLLDTLPIDTRAAASIERMLEHQVAYAGRRSISTPSRLAIEEERDRETYRRRYYVHARYGRRFNDGLSRLLAEECARATGANVSVSVSDSGFCLAMPLNHKVDLPGVLTSLADSDMRERLRGALADTELLKRYFRINATRALLVLSRYKGYERSAKEQQVSSEMLLGYAEDLDGFAVLEETYRELLEDRLAVDEIETVLAALAEDEIELAHVRVGSPSPLAFGLATLSASDVVVSGDRDAALRDFHRRVMAAIDPEDRPTAAPD